MRTPVRLLAEKSDTSPGEVVAFNEFLAVIDCYVKPSSNLSASGDIEVSVEISDSPDGPWKMIGVLTGAVNTANAGKLIQAVLPDISGRWTGYLRAVLSAAPATGSVTVDAYARSA